MQSGLATFRWIALLAVMVILTLNVAGLFKMRTELGDVSATKRGGLLWNSDQLEYEYLRFVKALLRFAANDPEMTPAKVQLRFDILWSRHTIAQADLKDLLADTPSFETNSIISEIGEQLRASEAEVFALSDINRPESLAMIDTFERFEMPLHNYSIALKDHQAEIDLSARNRLWQVSKMAVLFGGALVIGSVILAMLFMVDSRIQRRISRENLRLLEQSNAAYQAKVEFLSTVSHELRTPLTSIIGVMSFLDSGMLGELNEKGERFAKIAKQNTRKLEKLIDDLLDVVKAERGEIRFDFEPVDLVELTRSAVETNISYQNGRLIHLVNECDGTLTVIADRGRIDQVLSNLISNALKFSDSATPVTVRLSKRGDVARVSVVDQGIGIPDDFRAHAFESFSQADSSDRRHTGGTGLGLSITKRIIEDHGGKIYFDSKFGEGSTFTFELPTAKVAEECSASDKVA